MKPRLVAISGSLSGAIFPITELELSAGRHASNEVFVDDDLASRKHCVLQVEGDRVRIRDLESLNGTCVNGVAIRDTQLQHGDRVQIGGSQFIFLEHEDAADSLPAFTDAEDDGFTTRMTVRLELGDAVYLKPEKIAEQLPSSSRLGRGLGALLRISSSINAIRNTQELQNRVLELILEAIPAQRAAILLAGHRQTDFVSGAYRERGSDLKAVFRVSRTIAHQVLRDGISLMSNDVTADGVIDPTESLVAANVRSVLCVPLIVFDTNLGVIYADTTEAIGGFDPDYLQLLTAIAGIAAVGLEHARYVEWLEGENQRLQEEINIEHDMIGDSAKMREAYQFISKVATADSTVLILGESGTGKELVARAIHRNGRRANGPFVAVNCAAIVDTLLESELFGHEKGAFTGAVAQRKGKIEFADRGTLFLDEVGELPMPMQAALLRVLQQREFERVGGNRTIKVDVRVIAATNRNLDEAIKQGKFRPDLLFRLKVVSIRMPSLSDRREDIPLLASHFVKKYGRLSSRPISGITPEALRLLMAYDWPGNVRELENVIEHAIVLGSSEHIRPEDLPESLIEGKVAGSSPANTYHGVLDETKKGLIHRAFQQAGGNYTDAARLLDLHPNYLHRLIRKFNMKAELEERE